MKKIFSIFTVLILAGTTVFIACNKDKDDEPAGETVSAFTFSNGGCTGPCTIVFANASQNASTFVWDFGDGSSTSTESSPSHTYQSGGSYLVTLTATGDNGPKTSTQTVTIVNAPYYLKYKINGVQVNAQHFVTTRVTTGSPRKILITCSDVGGNLPSLTFQTEESGIGFVSGLNVGCSSSSYPSDYVKYTAGSGVVSSTQYDANGVDVFLSLLNYTSGGNINGTFTGSVKTSAGVQAQITEGQFKLKFIN